MRRCPTSRGALACQIRAITRCQKVALGVTRRHKKASSEGVRPSYQEVEPAFGTLRPRVQIPPSRLGEVAGQGSYWSAWQSARRWFIPRLARVPSWSNRALAGSVAATHVLRPYYRIGRRALCHCKVARPNRCAPMISRLRVFSAEADPRASPVRRPTARPGGACTRGGGLHSWRSLSGSGPGAGGLSVR